MASYFLLAANVCFAVLAAGSVQSLFPVAGFILCGYGMLILLDRIRLPGWVAVAVLVALFAYLRRYDALAMAPALPMVYSVIGLSYVLFRILHLVLERSGGTMEQRPSFLDYLTYITFFPAWLSGPIQRFENFSPVGGPLPDSNEALDALDRIIRGAVKMLVISALVGLGFDSLSHSLQDDVSQGLISHSSRHALAAACFFLKLYFNFSGSMDIVIAVARLMGFRLPENFDQPWQAANIQDFWARWHITLSEWFKSYLFNPCLKSLGRRFGSAKRMPYLAVVAFFVTFLVMGIWHGTSWAMVLYGVMLGLGISANKLYEIWLKTHLDKQRRAQLSAHPLYQSGANGLTLAYLALAMMFLWEAPAGLGTHFSLPGMLALLAEWLGLTVLVCLVRLITIPAARLAGNWMARQDGGSMARREILFGVKAFAVLVAAYLIAGPTGTIYKGF